MKTKSYFFTTFLLVLCLSSLAVAQGGSEQTEDQKAINSLITSLYDVISGPAGERDWDRFRSLFHEQAIMGTVGKAKDGISYLNNFDPEGYIEKNGPFFEKNGFFEEEIGRTTNIFGGLAQVFTAYHFRLAEDGPIVRRGINSIQLVKHDDRWVITQLIWQEETEELPIPQKYLTN